MDFIFILRLIYLRMSQAISRLMHDLRLLFSSLLLLLVPLVHFCGHTFLIYIWILYSINKLIELKKVTHRHCVIIGCWFKTLIHVCVRARARICVTLKLTWCDFRHLIYLCHSAVNVISWISCFGCGICYFFFHHWRSLNTWLVSFFIAYLLKIHFGILFPVLSPELQNK